MKRLSTYGAVIVLAFIIAACGHDSGQIDIGGTIGEVPISSATDTNGVSLDGAIIDPTKGVAINFESAVSGLIAYLECDGEAVELDVIPVSATQFSLLPKAGRYPQKTDCELRVAAIGTDALLGSTSTASADVVNAVKQDSSFSIINFSVACDYIDLFNTDKTIDLTAEQATYGTGCFKLFGSRPPAEMLEIFSGLLQVKNLRTDTNSFIAAYKRISGSDYESILVLNDIVGEFNQGGNSEGVTAGVIISGDLTQFGNPDAGVTGAYSAYNERWDGGAGEMRYRCVAGGDVFPQTEVDPCGDGSSVPYVGLINNGNIITPFYSFDGGVTKKFFNLAGVGGTGYDFREAFAGYDDLDLGIIVIGDHTGILGEAFIDSFLVEGDAALVK